MSFLIEGQEEKPVMLAIPAAPIEQLKYELMRQFDIDFMEGASNAIGVRTEQDARSALSMALQARKLERTLDESRAAIVKPHFEYQRAINKLVKDFKDKLIAIENNLHEKINGWMKEENNNPFSKLEEIEVEDGKLFTRKFWTYDVEDTTKVPMEFLCVDNEAVDSAIKKGMRNIPGLTIYEKEETNLRVKN